MPEPKHRGGQGSDPHPPGGMGGTGGEEAPYPLSVLQQLDGLLRRGDIPTDARLELVLLRDRVADLEEMNDQARQAIEELDAAVEKLRSPALRVATFLGWDRGREAMICLAGNDYCCRVDPQVPNDLLQVGVRVLCNEAFVIVRSLGFEGNGPVARVDELLSDGRLKLGEENGLTSTVVVRSALLMKEKLKPGVQVRLDPFHRVALEVVSQGRRLDRTLNQVESLPWTAVGGQEVAVRAIRDTVEWPIVHRDLFRRIEHTVPKGFLLYGPPGCGKTLLGKATAYNLREQLKASTGSDHPEYFLHVKGPELLNMWVGESERQVRELFAQCREKARDGALAFLFIDEAESVLGIRHGGRFSGMSGTMVPMFCTEMDGLEPLENVVVILASNRADLIDPAILRPGRIDRKIKVVRPDLAGARSIYEIHLPESLPLAEPRVELARAVAEAHYARTPATEFLEVTYRSGRREILHRGDLASGALIAGVVQRAKGLAIRRAVEGGSGLVLGREDLVEALELEYRENELFPSSDSTEAWLRLTDFDPDHVVRLRPVARGGRSEGAGMAI